MVMTIDCDYVPVPGSHVPHFFLDRGLIIYFLFNNVVDNGVSR